ncbi:MAG TPA: S24 family peptidase [Pyrinomonadaceae bacterium]|jgi:DNA polymerase V
MDVAGIYLPRRATRLSRPVIMWRIPAGFPSPADDYVEGRIDLNRDLIKHPLATFYIRVDGDSMEPRIHAGALIVVDRMAETKDDDIVVARLGSEFMVKKLHIEKDGCIWLVSENRAYPPIPVTEGVDFEVWGRVMHSIQSY